MDLLQRMNISIYGESSPVLSRRSSIAGPAGMFAAATQAGGSNGQNGSMINQEQ